ncbi:MAG: alpha/beta hydrolase [Ilumatobacteraceae bacterium]|nr:alpha/beta hydrolase [Ilumatobacteraceae bacterium]
MTRVAYDEFGLFHENVAEHDLDVDPHPTVARVDVPVDGDRCVSALVWGSEPAELVLVHGGAQNAHTWDTVALALGRPLVAVDLPGHGRSGWRADGAYHPANLAADVAVAVERLAPSARMVVGMSLGGLTSMVLAATRPDLVRSLVMVDITPGVNGQKAKAVIDFVNGPQTFASFDDLLARTIEHNPTRSESSLRRGILHNAHQLDDGSWAWRYDRGAHARSSTDDAPPTDAPNPLWEVLAAVSCPITLVRGGASPVVDDDDVAEARRRQPAIDVVVIDGAGHSVQGDRPVELAALLAAKLA